MAKGWRESGPALETAEDWEALIRAREDLGGHPPFTRWDRVPAVEDRASAAVRQAHPDARVAVWARPDKMTGRHRIDVRVARPDLTLSDAEALVTALEPVLRPDFWSLTVLDKAGPDDPQYAAFVCRKYTHPCARSDWPLIDPSALQRSGALEGE